MTDSALVRSEREGSAAVITMANAGKRNALSRAMMRALIAALDEAAADPHARAVIVRGEGPAFSAGHDLREIADAGDAEMDEIFDVCVELMETLQRIEAPTIAEVDGIATAAGCQLVAS